jgi:hypothetical protein
LWPAPARRGRAAKGCEAIERHPVQGRDELQKTLDAGGYLQSTTYPDGDVVRALVQLMTSLGFGGPDLVARVLARAGGKLSARSVSCPSRRRSTSVA